jgi:ketosteroid isomerase-like protein
MRIRLLCLNALVAVGVSAAAFAQTPPPLEPQRIERLHEELRAVKQRIVQAVNQKNTSALIAELTKDAAFTAINNDSVVGIDDIEAYYNRMMNGSGAFLKDFSLTADADSLSRLYANDTVAVVTGRADVMLDLRGGSQLRYSVPTRWTATLDRSSGQWKLAAIHFSADVSDNPFLDALLTFWKWAVVAVGAGAFALGVLVARRRRRTS